MKFLLDSNIMIAISLAEGEAVRRRMALHDDGDFVTSSIVYAEVAFGSIRGKPPPFTMLETLIEEVPVLPFDYIAARAYATLQFKRASFDHLIAAHALALGVTLVTDNEKHFDSIPGLKVENWTI